MDFEKNRKVGHREMGKLTGKVGNRVFLLLLRQYLYSNVEKPIEEITDAEFLNFRGVGPKTLAEIRAVLPAPTGEVTK